MNRNALFRPVIYLMFFILALYALSQKFYWHYSIWWFDTAIHFLGGFWQGIFFVWFFSVVRLPFLRRPIGNLNRQNLYYALAFVIFVGISWEAGEFLTFNYIGREPFSMLDTISDVFFDLAGGIFALLYALRKTMPLPSPKVQSN